MADIINLEAQLITGMGTQQALYQVPNSSMIVLQDLINATWNEGITTKEEFETKIANALSGFLEVTAAPQVTAGTVTVPTISEPLVSIPASVSVDDIYDQCREAPVAAWYGDERRCRVRQVAGLGT